MGSSSSKQLASISRLFSSAVINDLGRTGRSALLARLLRETNVPQSLPPSATLREAYTRAFDELRRLGNRDDYVYRNAITSKIALGRHNLRTATVINEMRAGNSKADLVILNGTATAYEIKSERDSLQRLRQQLADYQAVFASVNVVTSPDQAGAVMAMSPEDVGVMILSSRDRLQVMREANPDPGKTSPARMLDSMRFDEAVEVLRLLGITFPQLPNTQRRAALQEIFNPLPPYKVHDAMVRTLKASRSQASLAPLVRELPIELRSAIISAQLGDAERARVWLAMQQRLEAVFSWG